MSKKTTKKSERVHSDEGSYDSETGEWEEQASTSNVRWWVPDETKDTTLIVEVKERFDRNTRFGNRAAYLCEAKSDAHDAKGDIEAGQAIVVWESSGLKDLQRFVGQVVRIIPDGKVGRARVYRIATKRAA